jgi:nitrogen fixation protein FixH
MTGLAMQPKQFTGRHMLAITVAFFAVVIGVNLTLAFFANSTWSGLIVKNGYVASQAFNKDQQRARAQEAVGWKAALLRDAKELHVTFAARDGSPLPDLQITGTLRRPATDRRDQLLAFSETATGSYGAPFTTDAGIWDLEITASDRSGISFRKTWRFFVKEGEQ